MKRYKNLGGNGGILGYDTGPDYIAIGFVDGSVYLYTHASTGARHINQMKALAKQGAGLTTYINKFVRNNYAARLK